MSISGRKLLKALETGQGKNGTEPVEELIGIVMLPGKCRTN